MDRHYQHQQSHLFTVRMWQEEVGEGQAEIFATRANYGKALWSFQI